MSTTRLERTSSVTVTDPSVEWLTTPLDTARYLHRVHSRKSNLAIVGSILPLAIARIELGDLEPKVLRRQFDVTSSTLTEGITNPRLLRLGNTRERIGVRRIREWHVDHTPTIPYVSSFKFILSATEDPNLVTRYAPTGSPIRSSAKLLGHYQTPPAENEVIRGEGDVIYLMPFDQSTHASPEVMSSSEAILYNRFVHFAFTRGLESLGDSN